MQSQLVKHDHMFFYEYTDTKREEYLSIPAHISAEEYIRHNKSDGDIVMMKRVVHNGMQQSSVLGKIKEQQNNASGDGNEERNIPKESIREP